MGLGMTDDVVQAEAFWRVQSKTAYVFHGVSEKATVIFLKAVILLF